MKLEYYINDLRAQFKARYKLTKAQVAEAFEVSESTINRWIASNDLHRLPKFDDRDGKKHYKFSLISTAQMLYDRDNQS